MSKIISAVPNICEAGDENFINFITQKLNAVEGLVVLDVSRDTERNRTVISFTGSTDVIQDGGMVLYEESLKHIDMRKHKGNYPRIGAVDVFPFVPLKDVRMAEVDALAKEFAGKVAEKFRIPVFLFGESAQYPSRKDVDSIRSGEYEGLSEKLKDNRWHPDFGPIEFKPSCGATIIGARYPLISFKVWLNTENLEVAHTICETLDSVRYVRANTGIDAEKHQVEITVSISNYRKTPMYKALEIIRMEGRRYGLDVRDVQTIGLIPEIAFIESALYYMNMHSFRMDRLLERSIQKHLDEQFLLE